MKRRMFAALLVVGALAIGLVSARAQASQTLTATYTFSTATNQIVASKNNSGWWTSNGTSTNPTNDNYIVGLCCGNITHHNFFTFSLSGWTNPCPASSAYLTVPRADGGDGNTSSLTYGLYDVSTNPVTLNQTFGNNPNTTIYNDLGSGVQYGQYVLSTATGPAFQLSLNQAGLNAISQAHQSHLPYFSIGGALITPPAGDNQDLFSSSADYVVTLTVASSKLCKV